MGKFRRSKIVQNITLKNNAVQKFQARNALKKKLTKKKQKTKKNKKKNGKLIFALAKKSESRVTLHRRTKCKTMLKMHGLFKIMIQNKYG